MRSIVSCVICHEVRQAFVEIFSEEGLPSFNYLVDHIGAGIEVSSLNPVCSGAFSGERA